MIQPINFEQNNIVGFQMLGKITKEEVKPIITEVKTKVGQGGKIRLYMEFAGIDSVSWEALKAQGKLKMDMDLSDLEKAAYVSDSTLMDISSFFADLFPGIEAKSFSTDEKEKAKTWIRS